MTVKDLYDAIGANCAEAEERLMSDKFISKYIIKYAEDKSFEVLMDEWNGARDDEKLFRAAHTLKGVCLNLALDNLLKYAEPITEEYRPSNSNKTGNVDSLFEKLADEQKKTIELITEYKNSLPD